MVRKYKLNAKKMKRITATELPTVFQTFEEKQESRVFLVKGSLKSLMVTEEVLMMLVQFKLAS